MLRKALCTVLLLSIAGVACDDADPPRPRDGGSDARRDGGTDARDGAAADRTPDTSTPDGPVVDGPVVDAPVDTGTPDRAPDGPVDAPPDTVVPDTATPDTATPDTATPDTASPDTATPDTATPDTASPDTNSPDGPPTPLFLNGCTMEDQFEDETAEVETGIEWANVAENFPACLKVKVGTKVTWFVPEPETFTTHPLEPFPANPMSPILGKTTSADPDDTSYEVVMDKAGTFGFHCTAHDTMEGAIWVVP